MHEAINNDLAEQKKALQAFLSVPDTLPYKELRPRHHPHRKNNPTCRRLEALLLRQVKRGSTWPI
jgi:hypothetical protein